MVQDLSEQKILATNLKAISLKKAHEAKSVLIDVRSEREFHEGTIPGSISIPLFDNHERSIIGTIYKHGSHESAKAKGFAIVKERLSELLEQFEQYRHQKLTIFCAKGGMRSRAIVNLLKQLEFNVAQLEGGYRQYRNDTLSAIECFDDDLIILHGLTGTGKTRIIEKLEHAIDLEGLAQHRSSLFGGVNREPRNQKQFEAHLRISLEQLDSPPYFIEGESNKLGRVFLPRSIITAMGKGVMVNITASIETRIQRIIEDYPILNDPMRAEMHEILLTIGKRLGKNLVKTMCNHLAKDQLEELVYLLLTEYYDVRYGNMYKKYNFVTEISSENIDEAVEQLNVLRNQYITGQK